MTLAQNAQVEGELATLREVMRRHMPPDVVMGAIHILEGFPSVVESALLAEWSAGEGLDFAAAVPDPFHFSPDNQEEWEAEHRRLLDTQHRARLAAEREKWVAEVETLRRERDTEARQHERLQRIYLDTSTRLSAAEARVQRLEELGRKVVDCISNRHASNCPLNEFGPGVHRLESECGCRCGPIIDAFAALLPQETTK